MEIWTLKPDQTSLISSEDPPQMFAQKVEALPLPPSLESDPQSSSSRSPLILGVLEWSEQIWQIDFHPQTGDLRSHPLSSWQSHSPLASVDLDQCRIRIFSQRP